MGKRSIIKASVYAAEKHKYQRRKGFNQVPYINHPLRVAEVLVNCGEDDEAVIIAAILHDVIEDTDATTEELEQKFGKKVSGMVLELSDDKNLPISVRKELQVKNAGRLSENAKKIKIADKICNIQDMINYPMEWTLERRLGYMEWAEQVVSGCRGINQELESLFDMTVQEGKEQFQTDLL